MADDTDIYRNINTNFIIRITGSFKICQGTGEKKKRCVNEVKSYSRGDPWKL
ncbi:hypothetical protein AGMMS49940_06650 [Spirochaetia bacterium]|nr:hypothetical protein AGMMS49940_06650 [Spirochaetia bacterium]